jgi:hypothetical protein
MVVTTFLVFKCVLLLKATKNVDNHNSKVNQFQSNGAPYSQASKTLSDFEQILFL